MTILATPEQSVTRSWPAKLHAEFASVGRRCELVRLLHQGPLRMQRLFWPESSGRAHGYLLHPPGGLAPGDCLEIDIDLHEGAQVLLTTPSAGRVYKTDAQGHPQAQNVRLSLGSGSELEWLPQENILFSGVNSRQSLQVDAVADSRFFIWDMQVLGRLGSDAPFIRGHSLQKLTVSRDQRLLLQERLSFNAGDPIMSSAWGLSGCHCLGVWVCGFWPDAKLSFALDALRPTLTELGLDASVTHCDSLLVGRVRAHCSESLQRFMQHCWSFLRPHLLAAPAVPPRIWAT